MRTLGPNAVLVLMAMSLVACERADDGADLVPVAPGVAYSLEDGERSHREASETFWIPPLEEREALRLGQLVKLMFNIRRDDGSLVERMWVIVGDRVGNGYQGTLDNQPYSTDLMKPGMIVQFQPRHVIQIRPDRAAARPTVPE